MCASSSSSIVPGGAESRQYRPDGLSQAFETGEKREPGRAPVIVADRVNHYYTQGQLSKQVLYEVSAQIMPGEIVILTGPSGSGKTTFLTLCGALRSVQSGSMKVLGVELHGAGKETLVKIRRDIGFIFQMHNLIDSLTAGENVQMGLGLEDVSKEESRRRALAKLDEVGLGDKADAYPSRLSGGQRQRVAIARALVRNPKIILADEPTASLDRKSGREVVELLQDLSRRQGCAILLVTHDNRILDLADRIMRLEDGEVRSLEEGLAENASFLLGALFKRLDRGNLMEHVASFSDHGFVEMLEGVTNEFEQYLKVTELGNHEVLKTLSDYLLYAVGARLQRIFHADRCAIFVVYEKTGELFPAMLIGAEDNALQVWSSVQKGIAESVVSTGQSANLTDPYSHPGFNRQMDVDAGYVTRSLLCVPIFDRKNRLFAVVQLVNKMGTEGFSGEDEAKCAELARLFSVVVEGAAGVYD